MAEKLLTLPEPYADYPLMFGGNMPPGFEKTHQYNTEFAAYLLPPQETQGYSELDYLALDTIAVALTSADHRLGRNTSELGTMCTQDPDGLWHTLPPFYHNGDGTRLAAMNTKAYMDYINDLDRAASPYTNRETYITTLLAAVYDDIVFGKYGRGEDERQSAAILVADMKQRGFPSPMIKNGKIAVEASVFNELKLSQDYDPPRGAEPEQRGSLVGDLWGKGTAIDVANTTQLFVENLWKKDLFQKHYQILRNVGVKEATESGWQGQNLEDFFALAQRYPQVVMEFGTEFLNNPTFLLVKLRYVDPRINTLMRPGLEQSAALQAHLGKAIINTVSSEDMFKGDKDLAGTQLTIPEAFHCGLAYANLSNWSRQVKNPFRTYTPSEISRILLTPRTIREIRQPADADAFFRSYIAKKRDTTSRTSL